MKQTYDRRSQDVGNIISLEHVNLTVPDQGLATQFYVNGMGFTRDPYIDFGPRNVWINVGAQQFHLPTRDAQVLRGHVGVVVPDLEALHSRLARLVGRFEGTRLNIRRLKQRIDVTCPWGNELRCFAPTPASAMALGIPYVEFTVPPGTAPGIARFYSTVMRAPANASGKLCTVQIGTGQQLRFRESSRPIPDYDGHHIAIYLADFSTPHQQLDTAGLVTEESDAHQYRFNWIIDPEDGSRLFEIEHEVRSLHHPMYARPLTNRNADQTFANYVRGRDAFTP